MSFTPEFQVDSTGEWRGGAVSFATEEEATACGVLLATSAVIAILS
jgi:hypothetical protein